MRVLDDQRDDRTVLSWLDDGKSFEIRNVRELERDILPQAFDFDPSFRLFQRKVRVLVSKGGVDLHLPTSTDDEKGPFSTLCVYTCATTVEPIRLCKGTEQ